MCSDVGQYCALLESHPSSPYVLCGCNIVYDRGGLPAVVTSFQLTTANESAAITLHQTAHQLKRPCLRPGCYNVPRSPNPADEAIPSHPVQREQIRSRNLSTYQDLLYMLRNHKKFVPENATRGWMDLQDFCCQLESSWHVLFGQPAELPTSALVMDQLQEAGLLGEFAKEMEIRPKIENKYV